MRVLPLSAAFPTAWNTVGLAKPPILGLQDARSIMSELHSKRLQILQQVG
jgi:hypothetical protein